MEFIFQDKHATGEFTVLQTPYDRVHARDKDFIGDTEKKIWVMLRLILQHIMIQIVFLTDRKSVV